METKLEVIKDVFEKEDVKKRFHEMLGNKSAGFIVSVINTVTNDKNLALADRNSILFAAATAAALDLPINPNLGLAYIVAYKGKDGTKAQFQMGYKGFIQLAQRSGQFQTISASPIYKGQLIEENPLTGYKFDFTKKESDEVIGYAGYFKLVTGFEKTLYMTIKELKAHGTKYSQSFKKGYGLWNDNFDAMATKTVLKLLLSKFAPLNIEMQRAVVTDQSIIKDFDGNVVDYEDNRKETAEEASQKLETERVVKWIKESETLEKLEETRIFVYGSDNDELVDLYESKLNELNELKV